jgi:hypothetical protein
MTLVEMINDVKRCSAPAWWADTQSLKFFGRPNLKRWVGYQISLYMRAGRTGTCSGPLLRLAKLANSTLVRIL